MLSVVVTLDSVGLLYRLHLEGHAGDSPAGMNLACAALTLVVRTISRLVMSRLDWTVDAHASAPGELFLSVVRHPEENDAWFRGVTDTLLWALADIAEEYPDSMKIDIKERKNGS